MFRSTSQPHGPCFVCLSFLFSSDTSKTQDEEVGDGTTSVAVLAGELLREAQQLVQKNIHPQTILRGWRKAVTVAREALEASAVDNSTDESTLSARVEQDVFWLCDGS